MQKYDVIIIGGGGAGLNAAFTTAGFGKKSLLVEKYKTGGECTWSGCIPSKALIHLAELNHAVAGPPPPSICTGERMDPTVGQSLRPSPACNLLPDDSIQSA